MGKIRKIMHQETNLLNETYGFVLGGVEQWRLKVKIKGSKSKTLPVSGTDLCPSV